MFFLKRKFIEHFLLFYEMKIYEKFIINRKFVENSLLLSIINIFSTKRKIVENCFNKIKTYRKPLLKFIDNFIFIKRKISLKENYDKRKIINII